jgi:hypothetical protein
MPLSCTSIFSRVPRWRQPTTTLHFE